MPSEISNKADFSIIRYAQCWEDADILLSALNIQPGQVCLSIASAGDNTLAMLSQNPAKVIAIDFNPAQIACLELRVAAYRELSHRELLILVDSSIKNSEKKINLYHRCRSQLSRDVRYFWDNREQAIAQGIGNLGKFERYLTLFRHYILPLIHSKATIASALQHQTLLQRQDFYAKHWNNWRWQLLFRAFFSEFILGRFGRDPSFFEYKNNRSIAEHLLKRTHYAMTVLNPADNPYLQWIATGEYQTALPYALRPENFEAIRANLDRLEWHCTAIEDLLQTWDGEAIDCYNLSNIFEYMSCDNYYFLLSKLVSIGKSGSRLAYWNLLAQRSRPSCMGERLRPLAKLSQELYQQDKAFFYSNFIVEEII